MDSRHRVSPPLLEYHRLGGDRSGDDVAPVHFEFFNSLEEIARAKGELAESLPANGTLIYNGDVPLVRSIAERFEGRKISFGTSEGVDVRADGIEIVSPGETRFHLSYSGTRIPVTIPLAGTHFVMNGAVFLRRPTMIIFSSPKTGGFITGGDEEKGGRGNV